MLSLDGGTGAAAAAGGRRRIAALRFRVGRPKFGWVRLFQFIPTVPWLLCTGVCC